MFGGTFLLYLVAAIGGLVVLYSQSRYTFPGYGGRGGLGLPIVVGLLAIFGIWLIGKMTGVGNVFSATNELFSFSTKYDNGTLNVAGWFALIAVLAVVGVAFFNMVRYGKATM